MMWEWSGMGWWMVFGGIIFILFWGLVVFLIVWGVRRLSGNSGTTGPGSNTAMDIARERYARGEITREQFEQLKRDLKS